MIRYYKRDGTPYPEGTEGLLAWGKDVGNIDMKRVKKTILPNGKLVSTVWLGLDHSFDDGPPLIFETMVFASEDDFEGLDQRRYSTEAEALEGHEELCQQYKAQEAEAI